MKPEDTSIGEVASPAPTRDDEASTAGTNGLVQDEQGDKLGGTPKIGVAGAVFLILNKMIGTGSKGAWGATDPSTLTDEISQSSPRPRAYLP